MANRIELLAPAGDFDSLRAAVENGADAVYLGGKLFNARQFAGNFDLQKLGEALNYAHIRGVNIYLTMNTLISDSEMQDAVEFAGEAYLAGIDGIIIQDTGFAGILNKMLPDLPLHASTQMTVHNLEGVRLLERSGFKRVVLARELTPDEIGGIAAGTSLEVEVFIHGALCICYSGQCLMSSIIGGRSGNRGKCAQPCRLPYTLLEDKNDFSEKSGKSLRYLLSPRDLCTLPQLADIVSSGVKSLKIEGRMKSPEYVATVVRIYRKYLNIIADRDLSPARNYPGVSDNGENGKRRRGWIPADANPSSDAAVLTPDASDMHELAQVFNRGGFTGGYMAGKTGKDLMCYDKPKNWGTFLGEVISFNRENGTIRVKLGASLSMGDGIEVWNEENENPGAIVTFIRINGKNVKEAFESDVAEIGNIRGRIFKGCKVYKTSDKRLLDAARESFQGKPRKRVGLKGEAALRSNSPFVLKVWDEDGNEATAEGSAAPETAQNKPLTEDRLADQLKKTGATPFEFRKLEIRLEEGLSLPVSEINEVRREALDRLEQKRMNKYSRTIKIAEAGAGSMLAFAQRNSAYDQDKRLSNLHSCDSGKRQICFCDSEAGAGFRNTFTKRDASCDSNNPLCGLYSDRKNRPCGSAPRIALYFYGWDPGMDYASLDADRLYVPFRALLKPENTGVFSDVRERGTEVFIWTPAIIRGNYLKLIKEKMKERPSLEVDGILAGSPSVIELPDYKPTGTENHNDGTHEVLKESGNGVRLTGDASFNIFNYYTALYYKSLGFEGITLSEELNLGQICEISRKVHMDLECAVYGRLPLMTSEYCPVGSVKGGLTSGGKCGGSCSKGEFRLKDRLGIEFPVICDKIDCRSTILNSNVLFVPDVLKKLVSAGISTLRLYIWDESPERIRELVSLHRALACGADTGRYAALADRIKSEGFTKGHFYKGV